MRYSDAGTSHAWHATNRERMMLRSIRRVLVVSGVFFATAAHATMANAAWPERPVTVMVPFTAGGITDVLARLVSERLQDALKQPFVVENVPGAAGIIAAERVLRAPPDGYTLLFTPIFQITMAPFTNNVTFDPVKDFKPVAPVGASPFVVTVGASVPANTLAEFIAYVKPQPGMVTFGSAGAHAAGHRRHAGARDRRGGNEPRIPGTAGAGRGRSGDCHACGVCQNHRRGYRAMARHRPRPQSQAAIGECERRHGRR
jgi:tripartite-type tricarboxylate transporter receptor subunit TctC